MSVDRCPTCSAAVLRDAAWCSLCLTDLRPPQVTAVSAAADPGQPPAPAAAGTRGRHARRASAAPMDSAIPAAGDLLSSEYPPGGIEWPAVPEPGAALDPQRGRELVAAMDLSALAGSADPVTGLAQRLQAPGAKVGLIAGGIAVVGAGLVLLMTLAGLFVG